MDQSKVPIAQALLAALPQDIRVCSIGDNPNDLSNVECSVKNPNNFRGIKLPYECFDPENLANKLFEVELPHYWMIGRRYFSSP